MKDILIKFKQHPKYDTVVSWGKLISITGSAQIIVQAVGFASGILIIRLLPVQEYALYTLANTILGTIVMLSDGGISAAVMSQGGKVWQDKEKLGTVLVTGLYLRRKFALGSIIIAVPILTYLLLHQGASNLATVLIIVSLIPAFFAALSDSLLEIVPKLHQNIIPLQKNQITVGIARLILTGLSVFIFPWTFVAILAAAIPRIYGNIKLRKIAYGFVNSAKKEDSDVEKEILKVVKRVFPTALYHSFSGQIMIWLLSVYGTTTNLAQIGALGRVIMVLTLFSSIVGHLVIPRFSRYENKRNLLLKRYLQINLFVSVFGVFFLLMTWLFDHEILWVLGTNYINLEHELFLSVLGGILSLFAGISFVLAAGRGWIISPYVAIGSNLIAIFLGIILFDTSDIIGLLWFNIFISIVLLVQNHIFVLIKIISVDKNV